MVSTRNAEAVEDCPCRVGAIEGVEVNSCDVVIQKIVTLFQGEMNPDATDHFTIVFATLEGAQKFGRETRAAGEVGNAFESAH